MYTPSNFTGMETIQIRYDSIVFGQVPLKFLTKYHINFVHFIFFCFAHDASNAASIVSVIGKRQMLKSRGPFLERPGKLTGPVSYFENEVS